MWHSWANSGRSLGVLGTLGVFLERHWGILGSQERSWGVLGHSWDSLGVSWDALGALGRL